MQTAQTYCISWLVAALRVWPRLFTRGRCVALHHLFTAGSTQTQILGPVFTSLSTCEAVSLASLFGGILILCAFKRCSEGWVKIYWLQSQTRGRLVSSTASLKSKMVSLYEFFNCVRMCKHTCIKKDFWTGSMLFLILSIYGLGWC